MWSSVRQKRPGSQELEIGGVLQLLPLLPLSALVAPLVAMGGGEGDGPQNQRFHRAKQQSVTSGGTLEACLHCGGILHPPFDLISCCASKNLSCIFEVTCFYERDFSQILRLRLEALLTNIQCTPNI